MSKLIDFPHFALHEFRKDYPRKSNLFSEQDSEITYSYLDYNLFIQDVNRAKQVIDTGCYPLRVEEGCDHYGFYTITIKVIL